MKRKYFRCYLMSMLVLMLVLFPLKSSSVMAFSEPTIDTFVTLDVSFSAISFYGEISSDVMDSHIAQVTVHLTNVPSTPTGYVLDKKIVVAEGSYDSFTATYSGLGSNKPYRGWVEITFDNGVDPMKSTIRNVSTNALPSLTNQIVSNAAVASADYSAHINPNGSTLANTGIKVYEDGNPLPVFGKIFASNFSYSATVAGNIIGLEPGTHYNLIHYVTGFDGDSHQYAGLGFETQPAPTSTPKPTPTKTPTPSPSLTPTPEATSTAATESSTPTTTTTTAAWPTQSVESQETSLNTSQRQDTPTTAAMDETQTETSTGLDDQPTDNGSGSVLLYVLLGIIAAALIALVVIQIIRRPDKQK